MIKAEKKLTISDSLLGCQGGIGMRKYYDIAGKLLELSEQNQEGQTKISVYYNLQSPEENIFHVVEIGWNREMLAQILSKGKYPESLESLMRSLKMPY